MKAHVEHNYTSLHPHPHTHQYPHPHFYKWKTIFLRMPIHLNSVLFEKSVSDPIPCSKTENTGLLLQNVRCLPIHGKGRENFAYSTWKKNDVIHACAVRKCLPVTGQWWLVSGQWVVSDWSGVHMVSDWSGWSVTGQWWSVTGQWWSATSQWWSVGGQQLVSGSQWLVGGGQWLVGGWSATRQCWPQPVGGGQWLDSGVQWSLVSKWSVVVTV